MLAGCGSSGTADDPGEFVEIEGGGVAGSSGAAGSGSAGSGGSETQEAGSGGSNDEAGAAGDGGVAGDGGSGDVAGDGGDGGEESVPPKLGPPYPIVLAHGFFGFEDFAGVDFVTYFYGVKDHLASKGETLVFTPAVDPFNMSDVRGAQLEDHIKKILAETGYAKVNIIGHSQGGLDARVVAHNRPDLVASVTTFATPHNGTEVADVALKLVPNSSAAALVDALVKLVGMPLYDAAGNQTSLSKSLYQFSSEGIKAFNAVYTDSPGVLYQSFTGRSKLHLGGKDCDAPSAPAFVTKWKNERDGLEALLTVPGIILDDSILSPVPHDGLVRVRDAKWGVFLGCVPADHFDEIGQLFGDKPSLLNDWKYKDFYESVVLMLRQQGY